METRVKLIQNATTAPLMLIPDLRKFIGPSAHVHCPYPIDCLEVTFPAHAQSTRAWRRACAMACV